MKFSLSVKKNVPNVFPGGPKLKEEAMLIKERLNKNELTMLTASNGWLEKFKQIYGLRETRITGQADDIPKMIIQSRIECLPDLTSGYKLRNICNMDELGLFFKVLPEKALLTNQEDVKGVKILNNVL